MVRKGVTRESLVEESARLADEIGLERLTLAAVADRLGVRTPSLYSHIQGLPALRRELSLMAARTLEGEVAKATKGKKGRPALIAVGEAFRKLARARPGLYAALVQAPPPDDPDLQEASRRVLVPLFEILEEIGCRGDAAVHAIRSLRSAVHGFALLESEGGFGMNVDIDETFRWMMSRLAP